MAANTFGRQVILPLTNSSGGGVIAGDVVIINTAANDSFTTTTGAASTARVGIAQETIANAAVGRVLFEGYAPLVNVNASVTRGNYGQTHTVAKQAADAGAARQSGTFCQFLTGGTTPDALVWAPDLGGGSGISPTILDAKGDIIAATAADTAARLAVGTPNDLVLAVASGESTGLQWQARSRFKYTTAIGTGDISFSSTSKLAIDATDLAYQTHTLAVNDVVRCVFGGQLFTSSTQGVGIDFEVDQPTSANVFIAAAAEYGLASYGNAANRRIFNVVGYFLATEAGLHGFRPAAIVGSGTCTFCNATSGQSDTALTFSTEKLGPVAA